MATTKVTNRPCVIKSSYDIYFKLHCRIFGELNLRTTDVAKDAMNCGKPIGDSVLAKYWLQWDLKKKRVKAGVVSSLSQENILWLCERYGIQTELTIEVLPMKDAPYYKDNLAKK